MSPGVGTPAALSGFLAARLQAGEDGKTFLIGYQGPRVCFGVAAGLRDETDQERFLVFARYLLHQRFACDGHALLMPAEVDGRAVYAAERRTMDGAGVGLIEPGRGWRDGGLAAGLIGDLTERGAALPGLMRRDLDRLYDALQLDPSQLPAGPGPD